MNPAYDIQAPKKSINISINGDLLAKARELKINLSATLEAAIAEIVNAGYREEWKKENEAAIAAYNELVDEHGVFGDNTRSF